MKKGIVYVMTTAVSGLVKIGKTGTENFQERMRFLESNGYSNVSGLKRFFAIELLNYDEKEALLHELFSKHQVGSSELFSFDSDLLKQLLLSFEGKIVYPPTKNPEEDFHKVSSSRKQGERFSFYSKGIQNGDKIQFISDRTIEAVVVGEREVEYKGQIWKLSPLVRSIFESKNEGNSSGAYQGSSYWVFKGKKIKDF